MDKLQLSFFIKYGELSLKGKNRANFVDTLVNNVRRAFAATSCALRVKYDYLEITNFKLDEINFIVSTLKLIPGISVFYFGYQIPRTIPLLQKCVLAHLPTRGTFKLICKRKDKKYQYTSLDVIKHVAGFVLSKKPALKVNLQQPDYPLWIEIHSTHFFVLIRRYVGAGGLPVGVSGRGLVLLSGGIDSPVAAHMMLKRGMATDFLTFIAPPHTSEQALNKTIRLAQTIVQHGNLAFATLFVCDFSPIMAELRHLPRPAYRIVLMRRCFLRIAKALAQQNGYDAIITGEALGQVASQTIQNMHTIQAAVPDLCLLRPLVGMDKNEIIARARELKTYDISIEPYPDACAAFTPQHPVTQAREAIARELEQTNPYIDILTKSAVAQRMTKITIGNAAQCQQPAKTTPKPKS